MENQNYVTFPNQRVINVHRKPLDADFLGIKNENWMEACHQLSPHSMMLYFYFAANKDNYHFAFSPEAVHKEIGMAKSTCHDQFKNLVKKGYLVQRKDSNIYDFYEKPIRQTNTENADTADSFESTSVEQVNPSESREINNNKYYINNAPKTEQAQSSVTEKKDSISAKMILEALNSDKFVF